MKKQKKNSTTMNKTMGEIWSLFGSKIASILVMWAMIERYMPRYFRALTDRFSQKLDKLLNPYIEIKFFEYSGNYMRSNDAFSAIENYLSSKSAAQARKLTCSATRNSLVLKVDDYEEVIDELKGVKLAWSLRKIVPVDKSFSSFEKIYYRLTFHGRHRKFVTKTYLKYVLDEGKAISMGKRQRKLYTNGGGEYSDKIGKWSHVIWSASGGERVIIFTTNYVEKLDQALIRRGRMDKHIELSYCGFEGFKVLARNYLNLESHQGFEEIRGLLEETKVTPADIAENLMPKVGNEDPERCLERLIQALKNSKEEATKKIEKEKETATIESSGEDSPMEIGDEVKTSDPKMKNKKKDA